MATSLTSFLPYIEGDVAGCPAPAIQRAVRDAAIKFCVETKFWRAELAAIDLADTVPTYAVNPPALALVAGITKVLINGSQIEFISEEKLDRYRPGWETSTGSYPNACFRPQPDQLRVIPIPNQNVTGGMVIWAALRPDDTTVTVEDFLFSEFREAIANGAKATLLNQKKADWYDARAAAQEAHSFEQAINRAKWRTVNGDVPTPMYAEIQGFGI